MSRYTVTVADSGWLQAVHHGISADSEAAAIDIAKRFHPCRARLAFRAEITE